MTSPVSDAMERVEYALDMATDDEVFRGTVCNIEAADLRAIISMKAKEEASNQSPADEVERQIVERVMRRQLHVTNNYTRAETVRFVRLTLEALSAIRNGTDK